MLLPNMTSIQEKSTNPPSAHLLMNCLLLYQKNLRRLITKVFLVIRVGKEKPWAGIVERGRKDTGRVCHGSWLWQSLRQPVYPSLGGEIHHKGPRRPLPLLRFNFINPGDSAGKRTCLPIQETWVQVLGWDDPLEKEMATHSSTLAWKIPWTVTCQSPLSMGFSKQEYWNGLPFPSPGDRPNPGIEPGSPALLVDSLWTELSKKPL